MHYCFYSRCSNSRPITWLLCDCCWSLAGCYSVHCGIFNFLPSDLDSFPVLMKCFTPRYLLASSSSSVTFWSPCHCYALCPDIRNLRSVTNHNVTMSATFLEPALFKISSLVICSLYVTCYTCTVLSFSYSAGEMHSTSAKISRHLPRFIDVGCNV